MRGSGRGKVRGEVRGVGKFGGNWKKPRVMCSSRVCHVFVTCCCSDCHELYLRGFHTSGVYQIKPSRAPQLDNVYCEMLNGSGWTLLQVSPGSGRVREGLGRSREGLEEGWTLLQVSPGSGRVQVRSWEGLEEGWTLLQVSPGPGGSGRV